MADIKKIYRNKNKVVVGPTIGYISSPLVDKGSNIHLIGDCLRVGNLRSVIWRAYKVAMKI